METIFFIHKAGHGSPNGVHVVADDLINCDTGLAAFWLGDCSNANRP